MDRRDKMIARYVLALALNGADGRRVSNTITSALTPDERAELRDMVRARLP